MIISFSILAILIYFFSIGGSSNITGNVVALIQNVDLTEEEANAALKDAGCKYDISRKTMCIRYEGPDWVIRSEGCFGECRINRYTGEITMDSDPECIIEMLPNECVTDGDCANKPVMCASKYICVGGICAPDNLIS